MPLARTMAPSRTLAEPSPPPSPQTRENMARSPSGKRLGTATPPAPPAMGLRRAGTRVAARLHLARRRARARETGGDVEAADPARHLLRGLRIERLVGIRAEPRGEKRVAERAVAADVEADFRPRLHRHGDARPLLVQL